MKLKMFRLHQTFIPMMMTASLVLLITLLYYCQFNIEVTDEGYYINWIAHPWVYKQSVTQFGFIYHFLYRLVAENIVLLRQLDCLILFGLAWVLTVQMNRRSTTLLFSRHSLYAVSFTLSTGIFVFFGAFWWMPTPSYNSLSLEAALIAAIALVRLSKKEPLSVDYNSPSRTSSLVSLRMTWGVTDCFLLSLSYWLAFMAKPTTAALLVVFSTSYLCLLHKKLDIRHQAVVGLMTFGWIVISAWIIDGSLMDFYARLHHGVDDLFLLYKGEYYSPMWPLYGLFPEEPKRSLFFVSVLLVFLMMRQSVKEEPRYQYLVLTVLSCLTLFICMNRYIAPLQRAETIAQKLLTNILFLAIPLGTGLALIAATIGSKISGHLRHRFASHEGRYAVLFPVYLFLLPFALVYGTKMDVWTNLLRDAYFWVLMLLPWINVSQHLTLTARVRMILALSVCCVFFTAVLVQQAFENPFHEQQPLRLQNQVVEVFDSEGKKKSKLILSDATAHYVSELRRAAFANGFTYGTPIINLTDTPIVPYFMGTVALGLPWSMNAGVDESANDYIASNLTTASCEQLVKAWVLLSLDKGWLRYDMRVLEPYGIDIQSYQSINPVAQIPHIFNYATRMSQQWYKPTNVDQKTLERCQQKRTLVLDARKNIRPYLNGEIPSSRNILRHSIGYLQRNESKQAIGLLEKAVMMDTSNPSFYNNLCFSYGLEKKFDAAKTACEAALMLDPNFQLARNNLAWIEHEKNTA